jgi:hypothetical protein
MGLLLCETLKADSSLVRGISLKDNNLHLTRPSDLSMNSNQLYQFLHFKPSCFQLGIQLVLDK